MGGDDTRIEVGTLAWADFAAILGSPVGRGDLGSAAGGAIVVVGAGETRPSPAQIEAARQLPVVVVLDGSIDDLPAAAELADVVASGRDLELVVERIEANPQASVALALLLRGGDGRSVFDGLAAESAVYSTLQGGSEFRRWRSGNPRRERSRSSAPTVRVTSDGFVLDITLSRPEVRNALDARMRDELWDAFMVAASDPALAVRLRADGPSFCSGGDLDEFGSVPDPATGHLVRLSRSLGLAIHQIAGRVTVHVHGACSGSGIELPAFAEHLVAAPDSVFSLPELRLGLIPGAGGTVSLPMRIGRHRTAWIALTGRAIDAERALEWGLVDRIEGP